MTDIKQLQGKRVDLRGIDSDPQVYLICSNNVLSPMTWLILLIFNDVEGLNFSIILWFVSLVLTSITRVIVYANTQMNMCPLTLNSL